MKNKRILLISPQPFFQWRGSPIRVKFNLLALANLGYQIDLLTLPIGNDQEINGVRVYRVANPFRVKNIPIGPSFWKLFFDMLIFLKAISLCLQNRYDVIHGIEEAGFLAAVLGKLFGVKVIFEKHSDPFSYKRGRIRNIILNAYAALEKLTVRMASAVICTGPGLVDQVNAMKTDTRAFNVADIPSSLMEPSAIDIQATRGKLLQNHDDVLITFVGSFAIYQGVDLMFAAIPTVVKNNERARFVIIGGNPEEIAENRKVLIEQGVEAHVTFLGKIAPDILPNYLAASDILLSPRVSGINTPLKILDYMKAGRSIIATDVLSHRLLLDEKTAIFAPPAPEPLAHSIILLVNDQKLREQLGNACRKEYENTFTFNHLCARLAKCYDYVLSHSSLSVVPNVL
jgi:glycosyltransferase involved in cell wall biosynthesis